LRATFASLIFLSHHLVTKLLVVDEHPVVTRFWTFRDGVDRMLTFSLLRVALVVLQLPTKNPRPQNQRRLRAVRGFLPDPDSVQ
jgi:DNA/RNA-binding domain of Phe-tRNA-synthetase-like protein